VRRQPSQTQTSVRLATQAPNSATDSAMGRCSQEVWRLVRLMAKTSGDSSLRVSTNIFFGIQDSFTTQDSKPKCHKSALDRRHPRPRRVPEAATGQA
jgi:hypothetical protein